MSVSKKLVTSLASQFQGDVATGAGLNLVQTVRQLLSNNETQAAAALLKRAASIGAFGGKLDSVEKNTLQTIVKGLNVDPMPVAAYRFIGENTVNTPIVLNQRNFPQRMANLGFVPLSGININRPAMSIKDFTGKTRERFIDEGARNLQAAWDLDPNAAQDFSSFYFRTRDQLENTGIPLDRVGGAWATLSAQADPVFNAELLRRIMNDPTTMTTSGDNQRLALRFLAGLEPDPVAALGQGKRRNFMMNSIDPSNPAYFTADTRYAQNLQGIKNTYGRAPFADMFSPRSATDRYNQIYTQPGIEAANRMGITPGEMQAGTWGNWRKELFDIPNDLPPDLLVDLADFPYDPAVYRRALKNLGMD